MRPTQIPPIAAAGVAELFLFAGRVDEVEAREVVGLLEVPAK